MKLSAQQAATAKDILGADPIPEEHPVTQQLAQTFGEHSFYLDNNGLLVFERTNEDPTKACLFLIASWTDEERKELSGMQPQATNIVIDVDAAPAGDAGDAGDDTPPADGAA